jgi:N-acylglucosamine 2-epimerase
MKLYSDEFRDFYLNHLKKVLLPFWLNKGIDYEYGGYFTCFDNSGEVLMSTDKYTWSQGRMVWIFSKLSQMDRCFTEDERENFLQLAKLGAQFLMKNCILPNGSCTFLMSREGSPKYDGNSTVYDTSIYADCFVVLGLSRYAMQSRDEKCLAFCKTLYESIIQRVEACNFKTEPYPTPVGYKAHGIPMILLNVSHELSIALKSFADPKHEDAEQNAALYLEEILTDFADEGIVHEMVLIGKKEDRSLFCRYINPGHTIEDMWFIMHYALEKDDMATIKKAAEIAKKTLEIGWDHEYGGLFLFADKYGGRPKGEIKGHEGHPMMQKILRDWSNKLWWPHSEALYTTLLAHHLTGDPDFEKLYQMVHEYTFRTFPNPNAGIGEWIQIRDRFGKPETKTVALPVKDPFHIIRDHLLILDLVDNRLENQSGRPAGAGYRRSGSDGRENSNAVE